MRIPLLAVMALSFVIFGAGHSLQAFYPNEAAMLMNLFHDKQSLIIGSAESFQTIGYALGNLNESPLFKKHLISFFPLYNIHRVDVSIRVLENWNSQNVITIAGPALGSALYSLGGFSLPFYVLGSTILLLTVIPFYLLGKVRTEENDNSSESTREDVSAKRT